MRTLALFALCLPAFAANYYIDYVAGADTNNGTSTSTPWKRSPGMVGCASNCASHTPSAGDTFIFKGGVTWPAAVFDLTIGWSGSSGNPITYTSDVTWYTGGSWTRPIWDGEYSVDGIFSIGTHNYITVSNVEMKRITSSGSTGYGLIVSDGASHHIIMDNLYLHGWRTTNSQDDAHGGVMFTGSAGSQIETNVISNSEIENSENRGQASWGGNNGLAARFIGRIENSVIHDSSSAVLFVVEYDSNTMYNISDDSDNVPGPNGGDTYHSNGVYLDCQTLGKTSCYIRNSVFHDIDSGSNMSYLNGRNSTIYNYNNVYYGAISDQRAVEIEPYAYGDTSSSGTYYVLNNTCYCEASTPFIHIVNRGGAPQPSSIVIRNNHVIGTSVSIDDNGPSASYTRSNNLTQTAATASGEGYTEGGNLWAPTSGSGSTVDAGFDTSATVTVDRLGTARPQNSVVDIGAYEYAVGGSPEISSRIGAGIRVSKGARIQ